MRKLILNISISLSIILTATIWPIKASAIVFETGMLILAGAIMEVGWVSVVKVATAPPKKVLSSVRICNELINANSILVYEVWNFTQPLQNQIYKFHEKDFGYNRFTYAPTITDWNNSFFKASKEKGIVYLEKSKEVIREAMISSPALNNYIQKKLSEKLEINPAILVINQLGLCNVMFGYSVPATLTKDTVHYSYNPNLFLETAYHAGLTGLENGSIKNKSQEFIQLEKYIKWIGEK